MAHRFESETSICPQLPDLLPVLKGEAWKRKISYSTQRRLRLIDEAIEELAVFRTPVKKLGVPQGGLSVVSFREERE